MYQQKAGKHVKSSLTSPDDFDCFGGAWFSLIDGPSSVQNFCMVLNQKAALLQNNPVPFSSSLESPDDVLENLGYDQDQFPVDARSI